MHRTSITRSTAYGRYALGLLLAVNLLNYIDRQMLYAVFPLVKSDFHLSDADLGILGSAFMIFYMVSAPLFGWLGDRMSRVKLASIGLVLWSLATVFAGLASNYRMLFAARTVVGVGEASFGTVSPGLLSDFFPKERRGRILACFYLAIPVGSALGYLFGGLLGQRFGWHAAFFVVGVPGLILALPIRFLREPERGGAEKGGGQVGARAGYLQLLSNRSFVTNTLAMAAMTFALGGLAQWVPTFLYRVHSLSVGEGNTLFGTITVLSGISGTLSGGWLGDRLQRGSVKGYLLVSGCGFLAGAPVAAYALLTPSVTACLTAIFFAEFLLFLNTSPLNTVIVNVTRPSMRAMAFAVNIFFIHAFGDAVSPAIIGALSDKWELRSSLLITPMAIVVAAALSFFCTRFIERDTV